MLSYKNITYFYKYGDEKVSASPFLQIVRDIERRFPCE